MRFVSNFFEMYSSLLFFSLIDVNMLLLLLQTGKISMFFVGVMVEFLLTIYILVNNREKKQVI